MIPKINDFQITTKIYYGIDSTNKISDAVKELQGDRLFIVSGESVAKTTPFKALIKKLSDSGYDIELYTELSGEPDSIQVEKGLAAFKASCSNLIIAIGGGSRIDTAKAIALLHTNVGQLSDYEGKNLVKKKKVPLIVVSTTAGTGSDVTAGTVITDAATHRKMIIASTLLAPEIAIEDPKMTTTMPPEVTAYTGIDALAHALEGYVSKRSQEITDSLAIISLQKIAGSLLRCYLRGDDLNARMDMLLAQLFAGYVISHTSTGLVHAMGRPFGVYFKIPHGLANAIFLPYATKFSFKDAKHKYEKVMEIFRKDIGGEYDGIGSLFSAYCEKVKIPTITSLGIDKNDYLKLVDRMAEDAVLSGSPANNPRVPTKSEIANLYRYALATDLGAV